MKRIVQLAVIITATLSLAAASAAQTLEKKGLTLEGARTVIAGAKAYAKKNNAPGGVIAVVDDGGNLIALERLDGTFAAGGTSRSARQRPR